MRKKEEEGLKKKKKKKKNRRRRRRKMKEEKKKYLDEVDCLGEEKPYRQHSTTTNSKLKKKQKPNLI